MQAEILVVGLGNPWRGDDAAGILACQLLARRWQCEERAGAGGTKAEAEQWQSARGGSPRLRFLTDLLDPFAVAAELAAPGSYACLVLDAVMAGLSPGELVRWELDAGTSSGLPGLPGPVTSLHGVDLVSAWAMIQATAGRAAVPPITGGRSDCGCSERDLDAPGPDLRLQPCRRRIVVWGIQADPGCLWGRRLSPAVGRGLRSLVEAAWGELVAMVAAVARDGAGDPDHA